MAYQPSPRRYFLSAMIDQLKMQAAKAMLSLTERLKLNEFQRALATLERRDRRSYRRYGKNIGYQTKGLNGDRAVARRQRQIAAGMLTVANGLVA